MSVSIFVTALSVIFAVSVVALAGELLYVLWRRRSFRRHSSPPPPPIRGDDEIETPVFSHADSASKELLYFFCLKAHDRVDQSGPPNKNSDVSWPDDQVIDVFKLLEANGPSRFLCTIKEEDKEDVESTTDVDFSKKSMTKNVCLESSCLHSAVEPAAAETEAGVEEVVAVTVNYRDDENTKTVFSTPCDSPSFFTPVGSPARDFMESEFVVSGDHETGKSMSDDEGSDYV